MDKGKNIEKNYTTARDKYREIGVEVEEAIKTLAEIHLSIHCWQGDDVGGFERPGSVLEGGGIQVTGDYPGKARTIDELRSDLDMALRLIPGKHRLNLHASYLDNQGRFVDRDKIGPEHFQTWIDWARKKGMGLDFNPTLFSHPMASSGFTLSSIDQEVRSFWIQHCLACREIACEMGRQLQTTCVTNIWIPDGSKDIPVDRKTPRDILLESLDRIFAEKKNPGHQLDCVESKLFGIGSESYVVGSHEFYLGYAVSRRIMLCLDSGHYHPTETIGDKISSVLQYLDKILLHVSRPVRWDSDHVVILNDDIRMIAQEVIRGGYLSRTHIGLDFFDASINRVAAWIIGARSMLKALLESLLEPRETLQQLEREGDYTARLALLEDLKTLPLGSVWDFFCLKNEVPCDRFWMKEVKKYERRVLSLRS
jgi:L-rhamnose isomerase